MGNNLAAVEQQSRRFGQPMITHLNHPNYGYAITAEELAMVTREHFFEVFNAHLGRTHLGIETHAGVERTRDIISTLRIGEIKGRSVYGLAIDDSQLLRQRAGSSSGLGSSPESRSSKGLRQVTSTPRAG